MMHNIHHLNQQKLIQEIFQKKPCSFAFILIIIQQILMKTRIQLIQNSHNHKVPTVILSIYKTQFIFNVIPTLLRHRKNHKINLYNSSHIFFTKNSIQAIGGLTNYLLFRSAAQNSRSIVTNKIHIYCNRQIYNHLQKLRFKLGYKILRTTYCQFDATRRRLAVTNLSLLNKLKSDKDFPKRFAAIDAYLKQNYKKEIDYHDSTDYIENKTNKFITVSAQHVHHQLIDIYPVLTTVDGIYCNYICIPAVRRKGIDVNIEQFINKTGIAKLAAIKQFLTEGSIKDENGKIYRRQDFLFKEDYKPCNVLIFHYASEKSITQLLSDKVMESYFSNNNQTGVVVHILQDVQLVQSSQFKALVSKFDRSVKHLWFNKDSHTIDIDSKDLHHSELKFWSKHFPWLFHAINQEKYQTHAKQFIRQSFPLLNNYFYQKLYNFVVNDYLADRYQKRRQTVQYRNKIDILNQLLFVDQKQIQSLKTLNTKKENDDQFKPKVVFLGTASSMPTSYKNTLGIYVSLDKNISFILDCGEGTLEQLADHINPQLYQKQILKIRAIFITHIHSDHNLGILNFISERNRIMNKHKSRERLYLILPYNVYNWYQEFNRTIENLSLGCDVIFTQLLGQNIKQVKIQIDKQLNIASNPQIENKEKNSFFGKGKYVKNCIKQKDFFSQIHTSAKTKSLVLQQLPKQIFTLQNFYSLLKRYNYSQFKPVKVIHCPQSYGIIIQNDKYKVSYSGDTRPDPSFAESARNSNLMIHEATFNDEQQSKATQFLHSTVSQAIAIGKRSNSSMIALTHFNEEFKSPNNLQSRPENQEFIRNNTIFSLDHLIIPIESMESLPKITQFIFKVDSKATAQLKAKRTRQQQIQGQSSKQTENEK